ncbi:MAG: 5-amino-6-(D-ribitylamino)uracil--L-tyrosine 4-hydroxyphenyl transferase CofH [Nitrosopumilus sp.]|nr:5-amino-6-(D-ribitylamino)uracil--L-tyrosine 4-hydroxyphenyl transferase CofH [Nitrosopumilus sp.]
MNIDIILKNIDPEISSILDKALDNKEISTSDALKLFNSKDLELSLTTLIANELRRRENGNIVTFVVNRNINFTNVCIKQCGFCAFSRDFREAEEGYVLPIEEIVSKAKEAWNYGATEVCIQAGLPPNMDGFLYIDICKAIKKELPDIHIHAFSPEEILYACMRSNTSIYEYLKMLKEVGIGSLPGTSAEILVKEIRNKISPGRITVEDWIKVITTAHKLNIPTTSTIMYGHLETYNDIVTHLDILRKIQKETNNFTEFVPLSFIHSESPMYNLGLLKGIREGATGIEVVKMHAISRIFFNKLIKNIQVSWVKEGQKLSQIILESGANDMGGCLINESISTSAGSQYGQLLRPKEIKKLISSAGRVPAQRTSSYKIIKKFETKEEIENETILDKVNPAVFGSYKELITLNKFRYKKN